MGESDMHARIQIQSTVLLAAVLVAGTGPARAQCGTMQSHAAHEAKPPTARDVADAIEHYIRHDAKLKGGRFVVYDEDQEASLPLIFDRVHEDLLRTVGKDEYFTCADFEVADGTKYDIDVFVKGPDKDHLEISQVRVHKVNGVARYDWRDRDGQWTLQEDEAAAHRARPEKAQAAGAYYDITVDSSGFHVPENTRLHVGVPTTLVVTRTTDRTCAKEIVFRSLDISKELPLDQPVEIVITPEKAEDIHFSCGMDMFESVLHVE